MENPLTPGAHEKTPEQIEQEMAQTRGSLTEKVAALEHQVVGTVQTAADTLSGTVQSVKELITTAPGAVSETVKKAAEVVGDTMKSVFDITGHVRNHPWASVGVSTGLGFLTGMLVFRGRESSAPVAPAPFTGTPVAYTPPAAQAAPSAPGVFDELFGMIGRKIREVAENVISTASAAVNKTVEEHVPKLVDAAADRLTPDASSDPGVPVPGRFDRAGNGYHG